jgi:hypothetical protein
LEWDTGVILPVSVRHLSPGLAPQAGHSKSIAFIVTVYPDSRQHNLFHLIWYVRIGLISGVIVKSVMHLHLTMFWTIVLGISSTAQIARHGVEEGRNLF